MLTMKQLIKEEYWDYTTIIWVARKVFLMCLQYPMVCNLISFLVKTVDNPKTYVT